MNSWRLQLIPYAGAAMIAPLFLAVSQLAGEPAIASSQFSADISEITPDGPSIIGEEARRINAVRPMSLINVQSAKSINFFAAGGSETHARALDCLTAAVYYEAGSEAISGQRAVAQVVLNRVRHPAYPSTVCGVVYQGAERRTGCQFTFTCDGSLARLPASSAWRRARSVASSALAGSVYGDVGHATHYHADYVVPYWSSSLDRVAKIGAHIFYQIGGAGGKPSAFTQRYAGLEPSLRSVMAAPDSGVDDFASPSFANESNQSLSSTAIEDRLPPEDRAAEFDDFGLLSFRESVKGSDAMGDRVGSLEAKLELASR